MVFRAVSESCQINFVQCYANCPDPGDVLVLIIEATLRYGVSSRFSNLEICFLSLAFSISPTAASLGPFPPWYIYSPSSSGPHDMFNVERNLKDNPRLRAGCSFDAWKLCSRKLSDWKHQLRGLWMQSTTRRYIIYIRDNASSELYGIIFDVIRNDRIPFRRCDAGTPVENPLDMFKSSNRIFRGKRTSIQRVKFRDILTCRRPRQFYYFSDIVTVVHFSLLLPCDV